MCLYIEPDDARRRSSLPILFTAGARYGHMFGEVHALGEVDGAAVWLPPADSEIQDERMGEAGMGDVASAFGAAAFERFGTILGMMEDARHKVAQGPVWYLMILGVDTPLQGRGLGGQLIAPVLRKADEAGVSCYLDTLKERNVVFYARHGFAVAIEQDVPHDGPTIWSMVRPPR